MLLCDSNILIYAADPHDTRCAQFVERDDAAIASVSRIEVLGFPGFDNLSQDQQQRLREIVASMIELQLEPLVTRNTADFQHIPDLRIINPFDDE
jgi:predicted nucleic acid-binding protein